MKSKTKTASELSCGGNCSCGSGVSRREFLKVLGAGAASTVVLSKLPAMAGSFTAEDFAALVPADKKLNPDWVKSLFARGTRTMYRGTELKFIGMPVGGICAGQVYLGGDGRLWLWDIFNRIKNGVVAREVQYRGRILLPSDGANYVDPLEQIHPFEQGFAVRVKANGKTQVRALDRRGWSDISFIGEYPMGFVHYRDPASPVSVSLEAFSPFIPLDADESGLPATVMRFTVKNTSTTKVEVELAGWLENAVCPYSGKPGLGVHRNEVVRGEQVTLLECSAEGPAPRSEPARPPIIFEDFESGTYQRWTADGTAFGENPAKVGSIHRHEPLLGQQGNFLADSFLNDGSPNASIEQSDVPQGKLVSKPFEVVRNYIEFLIGGGKNDGKTCMNLRVDGKVVRTATGANREKLFWQSWDVREFMGRTACLEIVDADSNRRGHVMVDQVEFSDRPHGNGKKLEEQWDFGTMCLALVGKGRSVSSSASVRPGKYPEALFSDAGLNSAAATVKPFGEQLTGALARRLSLEPGGETTVTFLLTWNFPDLRLGRVDPAGWYYATRFDSAAKVAEHIVKNYDSLYGLTKLWRDTWYDSTLPYWFLDRVMGNTATLATMTCVRTTSGRFWSWEGVGCCKGTCSHVWQYAHAMARLFPELERTVRERADFGVGFHPESGIIEFRAEYGCGYATDGQAGCVLRAFREHQMSVDDAFLRRIWPRVKKSLEFLIKEDANGDGILEGRQGHTLDMDLYGVSSWLSSLYLASLRTGEEMAKEMGDADFARRCRGIWEVGRKRFVELLWNGEYFIHVPDPKYPGTFAYGNGCEIDQVMGQNWAFQVGLGRLFDGEKTKKALQSVWRYNFTPDVGPYRDVFKTGRWYALPGEGGLLICTFPKGNREEVLGPKPFWAEMYFNECQSGYEYEAAAGMVWENLLLEGLAVTRTIHDRYHASRRNPWNEVECGDHYVRCMAVYGVFTAVCGFEYHGPKGHIGFAPRLTPENFKAAFTSAEGWGTFTQKTEGAMQYETIEVKWGQLRLRSLAFAALAGKTPQSVKVIVNDQPVEGTHALENKKVLVSLAADVVLKAGERIEVVMS